MRDNIPYELKIQKEVENYDKVMELHLNIHIVGIS
jgi:hypothetical protein